MNDRADVSSVSSVVLALHGNALETPTEANHVDVLRKPVISTIGKGSRMIIRNETESDIDAISEVTEAAFRTLQISNHTEQFIIKELRKASSLTISLVAEIDGVVVGHIAFSPITISDGSPDWYGLGPLFVLPAHQMQGIGGSLVKEGLSLLRAFGGKGCALVGDPAFYHQFGFRNIPALFYADIPQEYFLALSFDPEIPHGMVVFHEGFLAKPD